MVAPKKILGSLLITLFLVMSALNGVHSVPLLSGVIPVGLEPEGLAYDSAKGEIFVANAQSSSVSVISDSANTVVATVSLPNSPSRVVYDSGKGEIFASNYQSPGYLYVISDSTNSLVATISLGPTPMELAYDSGKGEIFTSNFGNSSVSVVSDSTNTVVATIPLGYDPTGIAYDPSKGEVFVTNLLITNQSVHTPNSVSVISDATNTVIANIPVGFGDGNLVYDPQKGEIFAASSQASSVEVISDSENSVVATVSVGYEPYYLTYDSGKGEVFVSHALTCNAISVISDSTDSMISNMTWSGPSGMVYDAGNGVIYISNWYGNSVSMINDSTALPQPTYIPTTPTPPAPTMPPPPSNLPFPTTTQQPQPGLTISELPTVSNNSVVVYTSPETGINVAVKGPSLQDGTQVNVTTADYGSKQPAGTTKVSLGNALFYDVSVSSGGEALSSDDYATIWIINPSFTNASAIEDWNGHFWTPAEAAIFIQPDEVCCSEPASVLTGTPFAVGTRLPSNSQSSLTEIIYGLVAGLAVAAIVVAALMFALRSRDGKKASDSNIERLHQLLRRMLFRLASNK